MSSNKSSSQLLQLGHLAAAEAEKRPSDGLTADSAYQELRKYHNQNASQLNLVNLFAEDNKRFDKFRFE